MSNSNVAENQTFSLVIGSVAMTNEPKGLGQSNLVLSQAREVRHVLYETFFVI
jgi:hypothetical protein